MKLMARLRRWGRDLVIRFVDWREGRQRRKAIKAFEEEHNCRDQDHHLLVPEEEIPGMPDPDGKLSLLRETMEGRNMREDAGLPPVLTPVLPKATEPAPIFRKDGQVHNFEALSWGRGRPLTRKQYDARHEGHKPVPRRGAHTIDETPDDSPSPYGDINFNDDRTK